MTAPLSGAIRPALIAFAAFSLAACSTTMAQPSLHSTANGKPMVMKDGMPCPCCAGMKEEMAGKDGCCCSGMAEGKSCCSGTDGEKGMICQPMQASGEHAMSHANIYAPAMAKMHRNMTMTPTGDPDADFLRGMIPHHQGAIDMAEIALKNAKDPQVRKLAGDIVKTQESEIAFMRGWLSRHGQ